MNRPNIIFILSDQHSPFFTGYAGHDLVTTPNLDGLAASGTRFTNAYTPSPLCVPARLDMISGMYSADTCVYHNSDLPPPDLPSFARDLSESGYRTCLVGKAHYIGEDQYCGYQERPYGDLRGIGHQADPYRGANPDLEGINGIGHHPSGGTFKLAGPSGIPEYQTGESIITHESVKWLQIHRALHRDTPFLLSVQYPKPHFPLNPPSQWFDHYREEAKGRLTPSRREALGIPTHRVSWDNYLGYGATQEDLDRALAAYCGQVSYLDECIGHLLDSVEHLGFTDNTIIIYSADHGEMAGAHGLWHKCLFFEESVRVPMIFAGPGIDPNQRNESLVSLLDMYPTFCELAGIDAPATCRGTSLVPCFSGAMLSEERMTFSEIAWRRDWRGCMIRWQDMKYCWYPDGASELYDLATDPGENTNRTDDPDCQAAKDFLHAELMAFWKPDELGRRLARNGRIDYNKGANVAFQYALPDGVVADAWP